MSQAIPWTALVLVLTAGLARADDPPAPAKSSFQSVAELKTAHDRALTRDLSDYLKANPNAEDRDQAYLTIFDTAIEHDWFLDFEAAAKQYLTESPDGPVGPLARIVRTMAHAQAGRFPEAGESFKQLVASLTEDDQEQFASEFADTLASTASSAGDYNVARQIYTILLDRFGTRPELRAKVEDDLARLDMVGKAAPTVVVKDTGGKVLRLTDLKGKYVLIDFWATWCAPCLAELPSLETAYAKYHSKGLEIVAVSLDEQVETLTDFVAQRKLPWRQVHNATSTGDLVALFGVNNIPASFLIGPDGTIIRLELRGASLDKALGALIRSE
ncbi:MAG: TlpA disulfide reductase family protein [Isosphaeraceae bacterium]